MLTPKVEGIVGGTHGAAVSLGCRKVDIALPCYSAIIVVVTHYMEHGHGEFHFCESAWKALYGVSVLVPVAIVNGITAVEAVHGAMFAGLLVFFHKARHKDLFELPDIVEQVGKVDVGYGQEGIIGVIH